MTTHKFPRIYLGLTAGLALVFSVLGYAKPDVQFGTWTALGATGATSLAGPLGTYLARNLATVAVGAFALRLGAVSALRTALVLRLVTDGLDSVHQFVGGNPPGAGFALVMFGLDAAALWALRNEEG